MMEGCVRHSNPGDLRPWLNGVRNTDAAVAEARRLWPDRMLWCHPSLDWFRDGGKGLGPLIRGLVKDAGPRRFCLMISEEIPPDWAQTVPQVLSLLQEGPRSG